jgi:hypothetical protein
MFEPCHMDEVEFHAPPRESKSKRWLSFHPFSGSKNTNGLSHNLLPLLVEAVVAPMRDGARRHGRGAIWCMLLACGVGCFVAPPRVGLYQVSPQRCRACLRVWLKNVGFWEVATTIANAANSTTGSYLKEVSRTAAAFLQRRDAVDRDMLLPTSANRCK